MLSSYEIVLGSFLVHGLYFLSYCTGYGVLAILNQEVLIKRGHTTQSSPVGMDEGIKIFSEQRLSGLLSSRKWLWKQCSKSVCL